MTGIKRISITDPETHEIWRLFPDKHLHYWNVSVTQDRGSYWYWQMHFTAIVDKIYEAGRDGKIVKLDLEGGATLEL